MSLFSVVLFSLIASPKPLDEIRENFRKYKSFRVEFVQKVEQELFPDKPQVAKGNLEFKRPNELTWRYLEPKEERKEIIYDGKNLKIVRGGEAELVPQGSGISLEESFAFLWGQSDSRLFKVKEVDASKFILYPKTPDDAQFKSIEVSVKQGVVQQAVITDLLDGKSELQFKDWRFESKTP